MEAATGLTDEQERAAERRSGSLLLAAGAGSGKTAVLVERFARAVVRDGVAPGRILAITFTERAAGELRERLRLRLIELGDREHARQAEAAFVSTFHGFCARVLRAHPLQAGVEPDFGILEEAFASRLQTLAFADALAAFVADERAEAVDLLAAYGAERLRSIVLGAYAQLRSQGQLAPRLPAAALTDRRNGGRQGSEAGRREGGEGWERCAAGKGGECRNGEGARECQERGEGQEGHAGEGPELQDPEADARAIAACGLIDELLDGFGERYAGRKRARGVLDFDDLELLAGELLTQHAALRSIWSERFELLMVDEFQDTNQRQLQILAALDRDNLFTVGDELQSIYSFRHADVALFRERGERLTEQQASLALTRNFRSRPPILAAVGSIFAERMGRRFAPLSATRPPAPAAAAPSVELLLCDRRGWERPGAVDAFAALSAASPGALPAPSPARALPAAVLVPPPAAALAPAPLAPASPAPSPSPALPSPALVPLPAAAPWRQAEALMLAERIAELIAEQGVRPGEVVVLLRALGDVPVYEAALRGRGMRTAAAVGGFWSHQQVADLLAWLRALANPLDEPALYSVLASPLVGISSDGLALTAMAARRAGIGVWRAISELDVALPERDLTRMRAFRERFASERAGLPLRPIADLLARAVAASGYAQHVLALDWGERRLAAVHKLLRLARSFEAQEGRDLRGFLDHVEHVEAELGGREADAVAAADVDAVRLMSVHAAKGLEFPVVCVADLGREPNMRQPDLLVDAPGDRVGLRLLALDCPDAVLALDYEQLREQRRSAQDEEEDRILYVACTRARERLLLSGAVAFERWPAVRSGVAPIAWLAPALIPDIAAIAAEDSRPSGAQTVQLGEGLAVRCLLRRAPEDGPVRRERSTTTSAPMESAARARAADRSVVADRRSDESAMVAVPLADPDGTVSYTSLTELERCGYRYYLERVLHMPERSAQTVPAKGLDARLRGTIVHALLERIDFARPQAPGQGDVANAARRLGASVTVEQRREIVALIERALAAPVARELAQTRAPRRESPFSFSLGSQEPLLTGFLDLIADRADGTALVVDYKSDRLAGDDRLEQVVRRDYGLQRLVYALAAIEAGAEQVEVAHWFLERPERWVLAGFAAEQRDSLREQLRAELATARARGYAVSAVPHRELCLTCPGRGGLCSWGEIHTMRARSTTLPAPP